MKILAGFENYKIQHNFYQSLIFLNKKFFFVRLINYIYNTFSMEKLENLKKSYILLDCFVTKMFFYLKKLTLPARRSKIEDCTVRFTAETDSSPIA